MSMPDQYLGDIINKFNTMTFLRHNENLTYKVIDSLTRKAYLLRIHRPFTNNFSGPQHSLEGLQSELQLLIHITEKTSLVVQTPIRSNSGDFIVEAGYEGDTVYCSMLQWIEGRDLKKEDVSDGDVMFKLGVQLGELHHFSRSYDYDYTYYRPRYGIERNGVMLQQMSRGVDKGLFSPVELKVVEETFHLINSRLKCEDAKTRGIIHGDLNMGNVLVIAEGKYAFIDFGLFGNGYYLLDVAMGALMAPTGNRWRFLEGYFGHLEISEETLLLIEGFMLESIFGYYAFHMENEAIHPWIRERLPLLCEKHCIPYLMGDRIINQF